MVWLLVYERSHRTAETPPSLHVPAAEPTPASVIDVEKLSKRYGALWALRGASFSIRPAQILGLIGPNGSGKTTLFECVAGVIPSTEGHVMSDGRDIAPEHRKNILYYVPDRVRPWPDQRVDWILTFISGLYRTTARRRQEVIESLSLEPLLTAKLRELSKGEHKRVLVAIGLLTPHGLLLLDEPFDGLDLRQTHDVMRVLREHAASGRTLFLSIHQLTDAARICDRVILLSNGRIVGDGTVNELRARAGVSGVTGAGLEEVFLALT